MTRDWIQVGSIVVKHSCHYTKVFCVLLLDGILSLIHPRVILSNLFDSFNWTKILSFWEKKDCILERQIDQLDGRNKWRPTRFPQCPQMFKYYFVTQPCITEVTDPIVKVITIHQVLDEQKLQWNILVIGKELTLVPHNITDVITLSPSEVTWVRTWVCSWDSRGCKDEITPDVVFYSSDSLTFTPGWDWLISCIIIFGITWKFQLNN